MARLQHPRPLHSCSWHVVCGSGSPFSLHWIQPFSRSLGFLCHQSHVQFPLPAVLGKGTYLSPLGWVLSALPHCGTWQSPHAMIRAAEPPALHSTNCGFSGWVRVALGHAQPWGDPQLPPPPALRVCARWFCRGHRASSPLPCITQCLPAGQLWFHSSASLNSRFGRTVLHQPQEETGKSFQAGIRQHLPS